MRNLILLRHAKSSWKDMSLNDFNRPLNRRGKLDAPMMANRLQKKVFNVDYIISSSARRTAETAKIFADVLSYKSEIVFKDEFYEASDNQILEVIKRINNKYQNVLIVGHNPGLTNLVNYISDYYIEKLPTTGIVALSINCDWKIIAEGSSSFIFYDYPKKK